MSGAFGWVHNTVDHNNNGGGTRYQGNNADQYRDAIRQHRVPVGRVVIDDDVSRHGTGHKRNRDDFVAVQQQAPATIPEAKHSLRSTAANVLIVIQDITGSMADWPLEIFKRLPLLYQDAVKYLGTDDVEILFIVHGDVRSDRYPLQVARFGRGPELDGMLASFHIEQGMGGGQGTESQELVAYYLLKMVDTSSAQNVFTYFITDEAGCDCIDVSAVSLHLGIRADRELSDSRSVFRVLKRKMRVFTLLRKTIDYESEPILSWWQRMLGRESVLPLDDPRRTVDVLLGTMAVLIGQQDQFQADLKTRQMGTLFGAVNVETVLGTIALVGKGTPSDPFRKNDGGSIKKLPPVTTSSRSAKSFLEGD